MDNIKLEHEIIKMDIIQGHDIASFVMNTNKDFVRENAILLMYQFSRRVREACVENNRRSIWYQC